MNATLTKEFEGFAECCLELARSAETTERRARFIQMAHEYQLATLLISEELSPAAAGTSPTLPGRVHLGEQPRLRTTLPRGDTLALKHKCLAPINKTPTCGSATKGSGRRRTGHVNKTEIDRLLHSCRAWLFRTLANALFDPYRPELHYMRGPGPKWRAKYRRAR
jgi:hypothetical protein